MTLRTRFGALVVTLAFVAPALPTTLRAQSMGEILEAIHGGSRDFELPATDGVVTYRSPLVPTVGLKFTGFVRIDAPVEGRWTVVVRDESRPADSEPVIQRTVLAGQPMGFAYRTGPTAQLKVEARWSEGENATARVHVEWKTCTVC